MFQKTRTWLLACCIGVAAILPTGSAVATAQAPEIILNGDKLQDDLGAKPLILNGTTLVPMRPILEAQGANVSWDTNTRTVTANKHDITLTYRIGAQEAFRNGRAIPLSTQGMIRNSSTLIPLRMFSEAFGYSVHWDAGTNRIEITDRQPYEVEVIWGVNFRDAPNTNSNTRVHRMLTKGERVHVLEEVNAFWLKVQTEDGQIGYISAKPKFIRHASPTLHHMQMDELFAYAEQFIGANYEFGASPNQTDTFDCSSFVQHVVGEVLNIDLPRVSYNQAKEGREVKREDLQRGDLLFFEARGLPIGHVGIYAGDGLILHTYSDRYGVHYGEFDSYWESRYVTARRLF